jgi:vacuolar-type H+-ATPase subunit C/Vma6
MRYRLASEFEQAMNAPAAGDALRILSSGFYGVALQGVPETVKSAESLFPVELAMKRYLASRNLSVFAGYPFHTGTLLAYLNLKLYETQDIRGIVLAKRDGMAADKIRDYLITYAVS